MCCGAIRRRRELHVRKSQNQDPGRRRRSRVDRLKEYDDSGVIRELEHIGI